MKTTNCSDLTLSGAVVSPARETCTIPGCCCQTPVPAKTFWGAIEAQLEALKSAKSADDVLRICPGTSERAGFFGGSGGDSSVWSSLCIADWRMVWQEASYHWCMRAPNGDCVTYVEGDLYRGDSGCPS